MIKQRIFLRWPGRDVGVLFELDGTQENVKIVDFQRARRPDDVEIIIQGHIGTINNYTFSIPLTEKE